MFRETERFNRKKEPQPMKTDIQTLYARILEDIRARVYARTGVLLETEIRIL